MPPENVFPAVCFFLFSISLMCFITIALYELNGRSRTGLIAVGSLIGGLLVIKAFIFVFQH